MRRPISPFIVFLAGLAGCASAGRTTGASMGDFVQPGVSRELARHRARTLSDARLPGALESL